MTMTPIQFDPAIAEVQASGEPDDLVGVIGHLTDESRLPESSRIVTRFGDIATLRLKRRDLGVLKQCGACDILEASRRLSMPGDDVDVALSDSVVDREPLRPEGLRETGRGAVVGVVDWGIDFAHPAFLDENGQTRLLAIWDQRDRDETDAQGRWGYGRIISRLEINAALLEPDPYAALDYKPWHADSAGSGSHGTHVASIAAGSAYPDGNSGVAPGAELIFVHLANTPNILAGQSLGSAQTALEAMDFIFETAGDRPVVINLSVGAHGGSHTGRSLVERGMDQAVWMKPGRAIVNSAGNYRAKEAHASGRLQQGQQHALRFVLPPNDRNNSEVELFYPRSDRINVAVLSPEGEVLATVSPDETASIQIDGERVGHAYQRVDPSSGDRHVDLFLYTNAPPGQWQLLLDAEQIRDGRFHAWIERDASQQPYFVGDDVDTLTTIGTLANGEYSITTGAYDRRLTHQPIGAFSSLGPTRLGRIKPEIIAPGVRIRAARSAPRGESQAARSTVKSGTSMAAPMVAGTLALMFEAATQPLEISDTRALLFSALDPVRACSERQCFQEDLHGGGYGALNIRKAVTQTHEWRKRMNESNAQAQAVSDSTPIAECLHGDLDEACQADDDGFEESCQCQTHDLAQGQFIEEASVQSPRLVCHPRRQQRARTGDVLVARSPVGESDYRGVVLSPPGLNPVRAAELGMEVEDAGPGIYAEVLELDESGQNFRRIVRKIANALGQPAPGRKVLPFGNDTDWPMEDDASRFAETLPSLSAWQRLISFRPSASVQRSLKRRLAPDWDVHRIEDAHGDINLDFYPVKVTRLPTIGGSRLSPEQLLLAVRLDINRFIDTRISTFAPYNRSYASRWRSATPLGSVMHIDMKTAGGYLNPDDGSVVCSFSSPSEWIFSTIWTPADFGHPVSGNRQFGFRSTSAGFEFFTRGADRTTGRIDSAMSGTVFGAADRLWQSLQRGITDFVNRHGGVAMVMPHSSRRFNWPAVKARYWRPTTPWV